MNDVTNLMAPRVQAVQRRTGLLGAILAVLEWIHSISVRPVVNFYNYSVLGAVEESISSLIRESLALVQRSINGFSAWLLSGTGHVITTSLWAIHMGPLHVGHTCVTALCVRMGVKPHQWRVIPCSFSTGLQAAVAGTLAGTCRAAPVVER